MGKEDILLYWGSGSPPCVRVMIALEEKGFGGYSQKRFDFSKKEHKGDEVLAINPRGQLPTFRDGDVTLNESYGIIHYLQHRYPDSGTNLLPGDAVQQALVLQRYYEVQGSLYPKVRDCMTGKFNKTPEEEMKKNGETLLQELAIFDGYLAKTTFAAGETFSMADIDLLTTLIVVTRQELKLEGRFDNLLAYWNRNKDRPSVAASYPPHYKTSDSPKFFADL